MQEQESHRIEINGIIFECRVDASLMPQVRHMLTGTTPLDEEIDRLPIPQQPVWLAYVVRGLRWYRRTIGSRLGNRCVFEPSCSRYAEMAFRKYGFLRGVVLTVRRLYRCRPGFSGLDMP